MPGLITSIGPHCGRQRSCADGIGGGAVRAFDESTRGFREYRPDALLESAGKILRNFRVR